jgi:hypothetical protein
MCNWVLLPDKQNPNQHLCGRLGHPYCEEHQAEMDYIHRLGDDWNEVEATDKCEADNARENNSLRKL